MTISTLSHILVALMLGICANLYAYILLFTQVMTKTCGYRLPENTTGC
jgi:hypothetical protein